MFICRDSVEGGSWCPTPQSVGVRGALRNRVGGDTQKRSHRLNTWHLEEEYSTQGSWSEAYLGAPGAFFFFTSIFELL